MTKSRVIHLAGTALLAAGVSLTGSISYAANSGNAAKVQGGEQSPRSDSVTIAE